MDRTVKSSLLWGVIGTLSFLVLIQGYHLLTGEFVGVSVMVGVGVAVGVVTALVAHALRPRLRRRHQRT